MDYVFRAREAFRETPERYNFEVPGRQINIPALVTAFRGPGGRADVYVHYGGLWRRAWPPRTVPSRRRSAPGLPRVSGERASRGAPEDCVWPPCRSGRGLQRCQSLGRQRDGRRVPGAHDIAVEFETAGWRRGRRPPRNDRHPDFGASGLHLSDLLLAVQIEEGVTAGPGRIQRGDFAIQPAPWGVYAAAIRSRSISRRTAWVWKTDKRRTMSRPVSSRRTVQAVSLAFSAASSVGGSGVSTSFPVQSLQSDHSQYAPRRDRSRSQACTR